MSDSWNVVCLVDHWFVCMWCVWGGGIIGPAVRADFQRLYPANAKTPTRAAQATTIAPSPRWQTLWRRHGPFGGTLARIFGPWIWRGRRTQLVNLFIKQFPNTRSLSQLSDQMDPCKLLPVLLYQKFVPGLYRTILHGIYEVFLCKLSSKVRNNGMFITWSDCTSHTPKVTWQQLNMAWNSTEISTFGRDAQSGHLHFENWCQCPEWFSFHVQGNALKQILKLMSLLPSVFQWATSHTILSLNNINFSAWKCLLNTPF